MNAGLAGPAKGKKCKTEMNLTEITKKVKSLCDCRELYRECFPDAFRATGNYLCAWHEDSEPSLQPFQDHLYCHSCKRSFDCFDIWRKAHGGTFALARDALAARLGLTVDATTPKAGQEPIAVYRYTDESGALLFEVCRYKPKRFMQRRPDPEKPGGWIYKLADIRRVLYRLPELLAAPTDAWVFLNEGEKGADALAALGFVSTCAPSGAGKFGKWVKEHNIHEPLRGCRVVIVADNDPPGVKDAEEKAKLLHGHASEVRIIQFTDLPEHADAYDFVEHYGPAARDRLLALVEQTAPWTPPAQPHTAPHLITFADLMEMDVPEVRWVIRDFLPEGLAVLAGAPKIGKSWLAMALSLAVGSRSRALGNFFVNEGAVLHLALEDNIRRFKKRLSMMLGDDPPPDSAFFACQWPPFTDSKKENCGLDLITDWLLRHQETARLVVIDTLAKVRPRRRSRDDAYSRDYNDLEGLQTLAARFGVAVVVVHHQNKGEHRDVFNTISGSTGLTGACDTIFVLEKLDRTEADATLFVSGRDIEDRKGALVFDRKTGLWRWTGDAADLALGRERMAIRNVLRDADGRPMSPTQIADALGKKKTAVHNLLAKMLESGEVEKAAGQQGKYRLPPEDCIYGEPWRSGQENQTNDDHP